jgi:cysteine sulfinate desulfinase/cysteine desulfurase-like protein
MLLMDPSSIHHYGQLAESAVEDLGVLAQGLNCNPKEVVLPPADQKVII